MTRRLQQLIHVGCRELGLDADDRRALQLRLTGKDSMSAMGEADLRLVIEDLKRQGFKPKGGTRAHKPAPRADLRLVHVLWGQLGEAGVLDRPDRAGLNAFVRARFGDAWGSVPMDIDSLRDQRQISAVIRALEAMLDRAGVTLDRRPTRR